MAAAAVLLTNTDPAQAGTFLHVQIANNQVKHINGGAGIRSTTSGGTRWLQQGAVIGNVIRGECPAGSGDHGPCITLDGITGLTVAHNNLWSDSAVLGRTSWGVRIEASTQNGYVGKNVMEGSNPSYKYGIAGTGIDHDP